jgi:hypothetical protein
MPVPQPRLLHLHSPAPTNERGVRQVQVSPWQPNEITGILRILLVNSYQVPASQVAVLMAPL